MRSGDLTDAVGDCQDAVRFLLLLHERVRGAVRFLFVGPHGHVYNRRRPDERR
jgi:hypothetical protein